MIHRNTPRKTLLALLVAAFATAAPAARAEEGGSKDLAVLRNTVVNLLEAMVQQGLISKSAADKLVADAQQKAEAEAGAAEPQPGDVRVTYVPRVVQDQITADVKKDVQAAVVADVKKSAAEEGWGVPAALPSWVRNSRWSGDIRIRGESTTFADGNAELVYKDWNAINDAGGITKAGADAYLNTTVDQVRYQLRMGLGAQFDLAENALVGVRLGTGNELSPVTRNQVLGNDQRTFPLLLEEAYLRLSTPGDWRNHQVLFWAGRTPNPFQSTELVWDTDVRFNGFSVQYAWNNPVVPDGPRQARGLFGTVGAFPIQEIELSGRDKWLVAGQLGYEFDVLPELRMSLAGAYYDFRQVTGERNAPDSELLDFTAPDFFQKGNTVFDIRNDSDPATNLAALAADYNVLDVSAGVTWTLAPDLVLDAVANYVSNVGYDEQDIFARTGELVPERADGYRVEFRLGNPDVARPLAWRVFLAYHYAERDAVLDAFTESDLHRGGTDAEGYIIGGDLGITRNTWARLRFLSADEIDGAALGVDVLQVDLNGKF